jgi:DNA-binding NarL/FixJ family response regulator
MQDYQIADCVLQNLKTPLPESYANDDIKLTEREMQVLQQLVEGKSNKQIACSTRNERPHRQRSCRDDYS